LLWALSSTAGDTKNEDLSEELDLDTSFVKGDSRLNPEEMGKKERAENTGAFPVSKASRETLSGLEPPKKDAVHGQGFTIKTRSKRDGEMSTEEKIWVNGMPSTTLKIEVKEVTKKFREARKTDSCRGPQLRY
jgi:hypothetical protein